MMTNQGKLASMLFPRFNFFPDPTTTVNFTFKKQPEIKISASRSRILGKGRVRKYIL